MQVILVSDSDRMHPIRCPLRLQKLKMAGILKQNPGFEFLQECWQDDPTKANCDQETAGEVSAVGACNCRWCVG